MEKSTEDVTKYVQALRSKDRTTSWLTAFCVKKGYFVSSWEKANKVDVARDATHYLLNGEKGGVLVVPEDVYDVFKYMYAKDLEENAPHYLSERRTAVFKFLADLDFVGPHVLSEKEIVAYVSLVQNVLKRFYPETSKKPSYFDAVVLTTEPGKKGDHFKTGIHVVMPYLLVTSEQCLTMRLSVIAELYQEYGSIDRVGWNTWEDIVDRSVYVSNGLRMPGSRKMTTCSGCKKKRESQKNCIQCNGTGRQDVGRVYWPSIYLDSEGFVDDQKLRQLQNVFEMVKLCSIRVNSSHSCMSDFTVPDGAPTHASSEEYFNEKEYGVYDLQYMPRRPVVPEGHPRYTTAAGTEDTFVPDKSGQKKIREKIYLDNNSTEVLKTQEYVRTLAPEYKNILIRRMFTNANRKFFIATTKGYGSQICQNLEPGYRHNNTIYFYITPSGVCQRCWCDKDDVENRRYGSCKKFSSAIRPLTQELVVLLFKDKHRGNPLINPVVCRTYREDPDVYRGNVLKNDKRLMEKHHEGPRKNDVFEFVEQHYQFCKSQDYSDSLPSFDKNILKCRDQLVVGGESVPLDVENFAKRYNIDMSEITENVEEPPTKRAKKSPE